VLGLHSDCSTASSKTNYYCAFAGQPSTADGRAKICGVKATSLLISRHAPDARRVASANQSRAPVVKAFIVLRREEKCLIQKF
jgi:hypothetical protein